MVTLGWTRQPFLTTEDIPCRKEQAPFLPLSTIQGDIKPLIQHLQFAGRFRRSDLVEVIDRFHKLKSRVAPAAQPEYRPREANFLADFLAGEASGSLKGVDKAPASHPVKRCRMEVGLPYELLLQHQAIILGPHQYGRTVLALREVPSCPVSLVEKFVLLPCKTAVKLPSFGSWLLLLRS